MNDLQKPASPTASRLRRICRWLRHPFTTHLSESQDLYEDILRQATQTQSLEDLLERFPARICAALHLATFHLFILDQDPSGQNLYRLLTPAAEPRIFPASSATVARMKRERKPTPFAAANPDAWQLLATSAELEILTSLHTQLLFPLEGRTRLMGFVSLSRPAQSAFSSQELRFLRNLGPQMGRGLETALLVRRISLQAVERDRATRELAFACEVQQHLLPIALPHLPGLDIAAFYRSAEQVGGDYYDVFLTPTGALALVIADVSGKGVPASLVMAALRASLHALMLQPGLTLAQVLSQLNHFLFQSSTSSRYATLFLCLYHPATQTLEYSNAGHNPPLLLRPASTPQRLISGGPVIGLLPNASFTTTLTPFSPGDTLIAYTDGVTEAVNPAGAEWTEAGLQSALPASLPNAAEPILHQLRTALEAFTAGATQADDITLLVLTRPAAATLPLSSRIGG